MATWHVRIWTRRYEAMRIVRVHTALSAEELAQKLRRALARHDSPMSAVTDVYKVGYQIQTDTASERIIERHAEAPDEERWWGHIETPMAPSRVWKSRTIEGVITDINKAM